MAANRFFKRTPYDIGLYTPPVDVIAQTMAEAQKRYDTNYALAESLKNQYIPSLPQDRAEANALQESWNSNIDKIVSDYNGDYSKAGRGLQQFMSQLKKEMNPGGKGHAIVTNFSNYQNWLKEHQARIAKGDVLAEDLNAANQYYMKNYTGIGEQDPITGSYTQFNPETLSDYQDPDKIIRDIYSSFKPEKRSVGVTRLENGVFKYEHQDVEGIDPNRLYPSFAEGLGSNPKFMTYANQAAKFRGSTPEQVAQDLDRYTQQRAQDLGYMNTSTDSKWERDPLAVAREKAKLDKQNMQELMGSFLQYSQDVPNTTNNIEPRIDPENWKESLGIEGAVSGPDYGMGMVRAPNAFGLAYDPKDLNNTNSKPTESLDKFLSNSAHDKQLTKKGVIPDLMRAMWEKKKADFAPEFNSKYGKDPTWTKNFEKNFMYDYKKEWPKQTAFKSYSFQVPEPAKNEVLLSMLPDAINGNAAIYVPGQAGQTTQLPSKYKNALYTKEGKLKSDAISVKYVVPSAGYEAAGYEVSTPDGRFVIVDPNYQRSIWSKKLATALNPIFQLGQSKGAGTVPYDSYTDHQGNAHFIEGVPHVKYEYNPIADKFDQNIYMYEPNNTPILDKQGNPIVVSMPKIMDASLPLFSNSLGYGQTKSDATPFMYYMNSLITRN